MIPCAVTSPPTLLCLLFMHPIILQFICEPGLVKKQSGGLNAQMRAPVVSTHTPLSHPSASYLHPGVHCCCLPYVKPPQLYGSRGSGAKGRRDGSGACFGELYGGVGVWGLECCVFSKRASMREKGLAGEGAAAQGHDAMTLKLFFWELEKHLKR